MKTTTLLLGFLAAALLSCQSTPKIPENNNNFLGILEIGFGSENGVSSVSFRPSRIGSRALVNEAQLLFTTNAYATAVETSTGKRYLSAQVSVRNLTGANLANLTLVAYRKTGNIANTALKSVTDFGGIGTTSVRTPRVANINTYAQNVRPSQAMSGNGTVAVVAGQEDLALFTEYDLNAMTSAAGSALASGEYLLPYGFTVRDLAAPTANTQRTITANNSADTGTVTLAMAVDGSNEPTVPTAYRFSYTALVFENPTPRTRVAASLEEKTSTAVATRLNNLGGSSSIEGNTIYSSSQNQLSAYNVRHAAFWNNACQVRIAGSSAAPEAFLESTAPSIASSTPDLCFGGSGFQTIQPGQTATSTDIARLSDGRMATVGQYDPGATIGSFVGLYLPDGTGQTITPRLSNAMSTTLGSTFYTSIAVDSQDRIIRAGYSLALTGETNLVIGRSLPDANLSNDTSFSSNETFNTSIFSAPGSEHVINDIALQPDGKIVAVGRIKNGTAGNNDVLVVRYNTNGTLDTTFNTTGYVIDDVDGGGLDNQALAVAIDAAGKIILVGRHDTGIFLAMRFNSNGTRDTSFNSIGHRFLGISGTVGGDAATSLAFQGTKILVGGFTNPSTVQTSLAVVRFNNDGTLDTTFGTGGELIYTPVGTPRARAYKILVQSDQKFILTGTYSGPATSESAFVARYLVNGAPDNGFNTTSHTRLYRFETSSPFRTGVNAAFMTEAANSGKLLLAGFFMDSNIVTNRRGMLAQINLGVIIPSGI
jgi:uncharacterized delta-60 repeat protein